MNENRCVEFTVCGVVSVIAGLVLAAVAGIAFYFGFIVNTAVLLWICFGISAFAVAAVLAMTMFGNSCKKSKMKCSNGYELIVAGAVASAVLTIMALCAELAAGSIASALLISLIAFFFALTISGIVCVFACVKNNCSDPNACCNATASANTASNGFECMK